jgi:hypothetical protein
MMDKLPTNINLNLTPHLVKNPLALIAFGIGGVVIAAGLSIWIPLWVSLVLIVIVVLGVGIPVAVLLKNPQIYKAATEGFEDFESEATQHTPSQQAEPSELDALRIEEYEKNRGLFLTHRWRPSEDLSQTVDIIIRLQEHLDTSTRESVLKTGKVESVRYSLGRMFFEEPVLKRNHRDNFALEVSAYRPMLCLAEVCFNDDHPPVRLSRYIDFYTDNLRDSQE